MPGGSAEAFVAVVEAMSRGDIEGLLALTHPEVEAETLRSAVQGPWRGHEGVRAWMHDTAESFELFEPSYSEVSDVAGERVLAVGSIRVRGRGTGMELDVPTAALIEFRDGLMYRYKDYGDAAVARAAIG